MRVCPNCVGGTCNDCLAAEAVWRLGDAKVDRLSRSEKLKERLRQILEDHRYEIIGMHESHDMNGDVEIEMRVKIRC